MTCTAQPYRLKTTSQRCLLIRTWRKQMMSTNDVRYRIFRALRRQQVNSTTDVGNKLYELAVKLLVRACFGTQENHLILASGKRLFGSCMRSCYSLVRTGDLLRSSGCAFSSRGISSVWSLRIET